MSTSFARLAVVATALVAVAGCGSSKSTSAPSTAPTAASTVAPTTSASPGGGATSPAAVIATYYHYAQTNNCTAAFPLLADPVKSRFGNESGLCQSFAASPTIVSYSTGAAVLSGSTAATVPLTLTMGSTTVHDNVSCVLVGGSWKIANFVRTS